MWPQQVLYEYCVQKVTELILVGRCSGGCSASASPGEIHIHAVIHFCPACIEIITPTLAGAAAAAAGAGAWAWQRQHRDGITTTGQPAAEEGAHLVNWSATHAVSPRRLYQPETLQELEALVAAHHNSGACWSCPTCFPPKARWWMRMRPTSLPAGVPYVLALLP